MGSKRRSRRRLIRLMEQYELSRREVAELAHVSPFTVDSWLKPTTSSSHRNVSDAALELIRLKLEQAA